MGTKKIVILAMCCNIRFFKQQFEVCKATWAKDIIENKYDNIEFWGYTASTDGKYHINKKTRMIEIPCDDSINGTYDKTVKCFKLLKKQNIEFDYIFKTNCSTYINVDLLNLYVQNYCANNADNKIYTGNLYCTSDGTGPMDYSLMAVGNSMLLPKCWVDTIISYDVEACRLLDRLNIPDYNKHNIYTVDDNAIAMTCNSVMLNKQIDMLDIYEPFPFLHIYNFTDSYNYIAISVRQYEKGAIYSERDGELEAMVNLHNICKEIEFDENSVKALTDAEPIMHIVHFLKGMHSVVPYSWGKEFVRIMNPIYTMQQYTQQH